MWYVMFGGFLIFDQHPDQHKIVTVEFCIKNMTEKRFFVVNMPFLN